MYGKVNEDNFDGAPHCFRYWEIRSFGEKEKHFTKKIVARESKRTIANVSVPVLPDF